jgi:hypothetical protein
MNKTYTDIERKETADEIRLNIIGCDSNLFEIPEFKYLTTALDLFVKYGIECRRDLRIGNPMKNDPYNDVELKSFNYLPQSVEMQKSYEGVMGKTLCIQLSNDRRYKSVVVIRNYGGRNSAPKTHGVKSKV